MIEALSLDAAGTLFDLAEPVGTTYARIARKHGFLLEPETTEQRFRNAFTQTPPPNYSKYPSGHFAEADWWRQIVLQVTQTQESPQFTQFFAELFTHYESTEAWQLFPETIEFLTAAQSRFRLIVLSNFDLRLHPILANLTLTPFFETVISSADACARKPDPLIFELAVQRLKLTPSAILHIGDSRSADFEGALKNGLLARHLDRSKDSLLSLLKSL
ncbi:MAG: HAD-IA family hydrolase [Verrucomicrobiota bacterium]